MAEAALSGAGLDYVLESLATQELGNKRLVPVLADRRQPEPDLCLYYPGHRQPPPAWRAFAALARDRLWCFHD